MIKKIKVPGIGEVEVDLIMHPAVREGNVHVQKMSEKFYVMKYREFQEPDELKIIAGIKGHESEDRAYHQLEEKKRQTREGDNPIAGHIGKPSQSKRQ